MTAVSIASEHTPETCSGEYCKKIHDEDRWSWQLGLGREMGDRWINGWPNGPKGFSDYVVSSLYDPVLRIRLPPM
jgi:hypothetical protein